MGEIKTNDMQEVKNSEVENYQNITPETDMKVQDARNNWDSFFKDDHDNQKEKSLEDGKEDRTTEKIKEENEQQNAGESAGESVEHQETGDKLKDDGEPGFTKEEIGLLKLLSSGELDGYVGDFLFTTGGSTVWTEIKNGIPVRYKQGPGGKFFNGKENERYEGVKHTLAEYKTDIQKLEFLQKYGWLIENDDVKNYSSRFKGEIKTNDMQEIKNPSLESFRNILPETGIKIADARNYWVKEFNSLSGYGGKYNSLEERLKHTPSETNENCEYVGLRGNSFLKPSEKTEKGRAMIELLKEYGIEGITYKNGEPIFSKCAEATIAIDQMTEHREDYFENGNKERGNFSQADIKCAELWNKQKKDGCADWTEEKVYDYRKQNSIR